MVERTRAAELDRRALLREVNERICDCIDSFVPETEWYELLCECAREGCRERVLVARETYGEVHADGGRYVVVPGHQSGAGDVVGEALAA
jgi:hypothetical protein